MKRSGGAARPDAAAQGRCDARPRALPLATRAVCCGLLLALGCRNVEPGSPGHAGATLSASTPSPTHASPLTHLLATAQASPATHALAEGRATPAVGAAPAGGTAIVDLRLTNQRSHPFAGLGTAVGSDGVLDPLARTAGLDKGQVARMDRLLLAAGVRLVRVSGPGQLPGPGRIRVWGRGDGRLRMMRRLAPRGVRFMFTGGGAPPNLIGGGGESGPLADGGERGYARFLAACIEQAARQGTPFAFAAVGNEVDNQDPLGVSMTPEQSAAVVVALQGDLRKKNLKTPVVLGDNTSWATTLTYATAQAAALPRPPGLVASHAYGGDGSRDQVASLAQRLRVPLWMTEWIDACPRGDCPDDPSIEKALALAEKISLDLTVGRAGAWFLVRAVADSTHGPDGAIIVRDRSNAARPLSTTKRYPVMRQFAVAAPPGSALTTVRGAPPAGLDVAGFSSQRNRGVVLTRRFGNEALRVRLVLGQRDGALRAWRTSADESFRSILTRPSTPRSIDLVLPPFSITTVTSDGPA